MKQSIEIEILNDGQQKEIARLEEEISILKDIIKLLIKEND